MQQNVYTVGIDLAKKIFHLVGTATTGKMGGRKRLTRQALGPCMAPRPPVTRGLEAGGGAHDWARPCHPPGHTVNLMAPQCVKPSVQSNQNARREAAAMADAVPRPPRRFGPLQDVAQHASQALHRGRERLSGARPACMQAGHGWMQE